MSEIDPAIVKLLRDLVADMSDEDYELVTCIDRGEEAERLLKKLEEAEVTNQERLEQAQRDIERYKAHCIGEYGVPEAPVTQMQWRLLMMEEALCRLACLIEERV